MNSGVACSAAAANGEHGIAALVALLVNAFCLIERLKASVTLELRLSPQQVTQIGLLRSVTSNRSMLRTPRQCCEELCRKERKRSHLSMSFY